MPDIYVMNDWMSSWMVVGIFAVAAGTGFLYGVSCLFSRNRKR